jgi:GDP-L-fucose synthase
MKILVTGSKGLLGSAFKKIYGDYPEHSFRFINHEMLDLTHSEAAQDAFRITAEKIDCVIHCAALVGGIKMNKERPSEMFTQNVLINSNIIDTARKNGIQKLFAFSSACAFPENIYPLTEDLLHQGSPYEGNYAYGYAKRMVDIQIKACNQQYGTNYCTLIPVSLYGENDNFCLENGHFIPALIHKSCLAKNNDQPLTVWGDGSPLRELIYADDLAKIILKLAAMDKIPHEKYLIGSGVEVSIGDMARTIAEIVGVKEVIFDTSKSNGQHRKPADSSRLKSVIGDFPFADFRKALETTIQHFQSKSVRK